MIEWGAATILHQPSSLKISKIHIEVQGDAILTIKIVRVAGFPIVKRHFGLVVVQEYTFYNLHENCTHMYFHQIYDKRLDVLFYHL